MAALPIAIQHGFQSASHPSPSLAHQQPWGGRDGTRSSPWMSAGSGGGGGSGTGTGRGSMGDGGLGAGFGTSPIGAGGLYGRSGGQMGLWAPSGSWRGEGWQGLAVPPTSPSNSSLQPGFSSSMGFPSLPSPFQPHSFLPSSPSYSSRGGELSMSVDSAPSTSYTHQDLGNMLAQHKRNQQQAAFPGGGAGPPVSSSFQGPGSVERLSQLEQNFTSNFTCCGLQLKGLHDLLEHYEESHVLVTPQAQASASAPSIASFQRQPVPRSLPAGGVSALSGPSSPHNMPSASQFSQSLNFGSSTPSPTTDSDAPHTPSMMDLEMDDAPLPSPFPHSSHSGHISSSANFASPWSSASALTTHSSQPTPQCVPPSLLTYPIPSRGASPSSLLSESSMGGSFSVGSLPTREMSPPSIEPPIVASLPATVPPVKKERKKKEKVPKERNEHGEEIIPPGEKRFRCPIEGCGKVYKQQNGLKYHLQRSINSSHAHVGGLVSSSGAVIPPPPSSVISPSG